MYSIYKMATIQQVNELDGGIYLKLIRNGKKVISVMIHDSNETTAQFYTVVGLQDCAYKFIYNEPCSLCEDLAEITQYIRRYIPRITHLWMMSGHFIRDGNYGPGRAIPWELLSFAFTGTNRLQSTFQIEVHEEMQRDYELYLEGTHRYTAVLPTNERKVLPLRVVREIEELLPYYPITLQTMEDILQTCQTWMEFVRKIDQKLKEERICLADRFQFYRYWVMSLIYEHNVYVPKTWTWKI